MEKINIEQVGSKELADRKKHRIQLTKTFDISGVTTGRFSSKTQLTVAVDWSYDENKKNRSKTGKLKRTKVSKIKVGDQTVRKYIYRTT